jgi:hypothetical protein
MSTYEKNMAEVIAFFDIELPFWIGLKDGVYKIMVDGKIWPIELYNDKWKVSMSNEIDHDAPITALVNNREELKDIQNVFKHSPYYHKEKLYSMIRTNFVWTTDGELSKEEARKIFINNFNWCKTTLLDRINRFIEIYRTSGSPDRIPYTLCTYDLCRNWWYSILLNGKWIEGSKIGFDLYANMDKPPIMLDEPVQKDIVEKLKSGYVPSPSHLLFENAISSHIRGRYITASIESFTAFDIFLLNFLQEIFEEKQYDKELIKYLMKCCNNFNFMLLDGMRIALGKSYNQIDQKLWDQWCKFISPLRNDVIHRAKNVTEKESETVIKVLTEIVNSLNNYLDKNKKTLNTKSN